MLSEEARNALVDDINGLDFTYEDWDPDVKVWRHNEGNKLEYPLITLEFTPTDRKKFQSISNVIGKATPYGTYNEFGFCHVEVCTIRFYCKKGHNSGDVEARKLMEHMYKIVLKQIYKNWDFLLEHYYASIDILDTVPSLREYTNYKGKYATKTYVMETTIYIRTHFSWTDKPANYDDTEYLVNKIGKIEMNEENIGRIEYEEE